jgi:hypothetical protein
LLWVRDWMKHGQNYPTYMFEIFFVEVFTWKKITFLLIPAHRVLKMHYSRGSASNLVSANDRTSPIEWAFQCIDLISKFSAFIRISTNPYLQPSFFEPFDGYNYGLLWTKHHNLLKAF